MFSRLCLAWWPYWTRTHIQHNTPKRQMALGKRARIDRRWRLARTLTKHTAIYAHNMYCALTVSRAVPCRWARTLHHRHPGDLRTPTHHTYKRRKKPQCQHKSMFAKNGEKCAALRQHTYHKTVAIFYQNLSCATVTFEEALQITFTNAVGQTTDIHTRSNHDEDWWGFCSLVSNQQIKVHTRTAHWKSKRGANNRPTWFSLEKSMELVRSTHSLQAATRRATGVTTDEREMNECECWIWMNEAK